MNRIILSTFFVLLTTIIRSQTINVVGDWNNKIAYYDAINEEQKSYIVKGKIVKENDLFYLKAWCKDLINNTENRFKVKLVITNSSVVIFPHNYKYVQYYNAENKKWITITPKNKIWYYVSVMACDDVVTLHYYNENNFNILEGYCTDNIMYWNLKQKIQFYP